MYFVKLKKFFVLYFAKRFFALTTEDTSERIERPKHAVYPCNSNRSLFFHDTMEEKRKKGSWRINYFSYFTTDAGYPQTNAPSLPAAATTTTIYRHLIPLSRCDDYVRLSFLIYEPEKFRGSLYRSTAYSCDFLFIFGVRISDVLLVLSDNRSFTSRSDFFFIEYAQRVSFSGTRNGVSQLSRSSNRKSVSC